MNIHDQSLIFDGIQHLLLVLKVKSALGDNYCTGEFVMDRDLI